MFGQGYFTERLYFAYLLELKEAVQDLYYKVLYYASQKTSKNLMNGRGKKALDMGCAFGYVTDLLRNLGYDAVGLDLSKYAIRKAQQSSAHSNFVVADGNSAPFKNNSFNLITCFELIEHIPKPIMLIEEIGRLLKEDGICVLTTPVRGPIKKLYDRLRGEKTHISLFVPKEVYQIFGKRFKHLSVQTNLLLPIPPQLFNKYFLLNHTPMLLSSEMWISAIKKKD